MRVQHELGGITRSRPSSTSSGVLPGARPVRLPTRNTWVSTAMVCSPNAMLSTTLAVLRPAPGSDFDFGAGARHLAAEFGDQLFRQRNDVLRLVAVEPDGLDVIADLVLAEREHLLRRVGDRKQRACRLVDAGVGRLRRQNDRDQQRVGIEMLKFALRLGIDLSEAAERVADFGWGPRL